MKTIALFILGYILGMILYLVYNNLKKMIKQLKQ